MKGLGSTGSLLLAVIHFGLWCPVSPSHGDPLAISIELDLPVYLLQGMPDPEAAKHPTQFFSGRGIRILGSFPSVRSKEDIRIQLKGKKTKVEPTVEVQTANSESIHLKIPLVIPTDSYELSLIAGTVVHKADLKIIGIPIPQDRTQRSLGVGEEPETPPAILYSSRLNCPRGDC